MKKYKYYHHNITSRFWGPITYTLLGVNKKGFWAQWDIIYSGLDKEYYNEVVESHGLMRI